MKPRTAPSLREDRITAVLLALGAAFENRSHNRSQGRAQHAWVAAIPIVIVNCVAFRAQLRFWQAHLTAGDAILVSVALESIAIYLAWQAHLAQLADDSSFRLRFGAYGMALLIGTLNYSHYMKPGWRPTVAAVTFGMLSAISPWLWSIHSRRGSRDWLKALRLIEDHAVRLGATRWFFHAYRCLRVMRAATWKGENRPAEAIALVYPGEPARSTASQSPPPESRSREPRPVYPVSAKARDAGLAAARSQAEALLASDLASGAVILPDGRGRLAALMRNERLSGSESSRQRAARRVLALAASMQDGHARVNGS